jgi:hypothetical protein
MKLHVSHGPDDGPHFIPLKIVPHQLDIGRDFALEVLRAWNPKNFSYTPPPLIRVSKVSETLVQGRMVLWRETALYAPQALEPPRGSAHSCSRGWFHVIRIDWVKISIQPDRPSARRAFDGTSWLFKDVGAKIDILGPFPEKFSYDLSYCTVCDGPFDGPVMPSATLVFERQKDKARIKFVGVPDGTEKLPNVHPASWFSVYNEILPS